MATDTQPPQEYVQLTLTPTDAQRLQGMAWLGQMVVQKLNDLGALGPLWLMVFHEDQECPRAAFGMIAGYRSFTEARAVSQQEFAEALTAGYRRVQEIDQKICEYLIDSAWMQNRPKYHDPNTKEDPDAGP